MRSFLFYFLIVFSSVSFAQNVAINATGAAPVASAMLDITSTTSGLLIPRMSSVQRVAIASPATGLKVYDTTTNTFWWFNGVIWVEQLGTNNGWALVGNTLAGTEKLGSLNAQPVMFFSNNTERMRILATGEVVVSFSMLTVNADEHSGFRRNAFEPSIKGGMSHTFHLAKYLWRCLSRLCARVRVLLI